MAAIKDAVRHCFAVMLYHVCCLSCCPAEESESGEADEELEADNLPTLHEKSADWRAHIQAQASKTGGYTRPRASAAPRTDVELESQACNFRTAYDGKLYYGEDDPGATMYAL